MKKILFAFTAVATLSFAFTTLSEVLPIGASMPKADLKLKDISGKEVSLKDAKKKNGLLVMFSCNTCPWVIKNQSRTIEVANYALSKDIGEINYWIMVLFTGYDITYQFFQLIHELCYRQIRYKCKNKNTCRWYCYQ